MTKAKATPPTPAFAQWERNAARYIATWMIRGAEKRKVTDGEVDVFLKKWREIIEDVVPHVPRDQSALGAAICKCAIFFNPQRAIAFLKNYRSFYFDGEKDPAQQFRAWYDGQSRNRPADGQRMYIATLMACRAFCEYRHNLPIRTDGYQRLRVKRGGGDLFVWSKDWSPISLEEKK